MELSCFPYPHIINYNFLPMCMIESVKQQYDDVLNNNTWDIYDNPLEHKRSYNKLKDNEVFKQVIEYVGSKDFVELLQKTFDIEDIELDRDMYGAGFHNHERGGFLSTHLDYEINPHTFKKRYLNLIIYLNHDWEKSYNGYTELWNSDCTRCEVEVIPEFNKALIFRTDNLSWHGVTKKINCPDNMSRKTIAFYYVSKKSYANEINEHTRMKAHYNNPKFPKLCEIRKHRRLTKDDIKIQ